jgi:hypothetical protein
MRSSWEALVDHGRRLLRNEEGRSWEWADLVLEVMPKGTERETLEEWAHAIGWLDTGRKTATLLGLRYHAAEWPPEKRCASASFTAHAELSGHPERFERIKPGMTKRQARVAADKKPEIGSREARSTVIAGLLSDPEVLEQVMDDPEAVKALRRASADVATHLERRSKAERAERAPDLHSAEGWLRVLGRLDAARRDVVNAVSEAMELDQTGHSADGYKAEAARKVEDLAHRLDLAALYLADGPTASLEEQLAALTEGDSLA